MLQCVEEKDKALAAVAELEEQQRQETQRTPLGELEKAVDEAGNVISYYVCVSVCVCECVYYVYVACVTICVCVCVTIVYDGNGDLYRLWH